MGHVHSRRHRYETVPPILGDLFQEDYSLGNSFDTCCKYYLSHAWKIRANVYNL